MIDGATGQIDHEFTAPATSSSGSAASLAIAQGGDRAVVVSNFSANKNHKWIRVDLVNLSTGKISGSVTTEDATSEGVSVDPLNGLLYVGYQSITDGSSHIEVINPSTLKVTLDAQVSCNVLLPGGGQVYCATSGGVTVLNAKTLDSIGSLELAGGAGSLALSPDGSVLYAVYGTSVAFVDTTTLDVTQSVAVGSTFGLAVSPDGSELYFGAGSSLLTLNTTTFAQTNLPVNPQSGFAVAANGNLYWQNGNSIVVFDPAAQTVAATYPAPQSGGFALDPATAQLCFLAIGDTSTISATAAAPCAAGAKSAPTPGPYTGAYDHKDNLILLPDYQAEVEALDAVTLKTKGFISMPSGTYGAITYQVLFGDEGGQGYTFIQDAGLGIAFEEQRQSGRSGTIRDPRNVTIRFVYL